MYKDVQPHGVIEIDQILKDAALLGPAPSMESLVHGVVDMIPRNHIGWNQMTATYHASNESDLHSSLVKLTTGRGEKYDHPRVSRAIFESFKHAPDLMNLYHNAE